MIVASFFAARPDQFPDAPDYRPLLALLDRSAARRGVRHVCITDFETAPSLPCSTFAVADLPGPLMQAVIAGQLAFLRSALADNDLILLGADCLVNADPRTAFASRDFDIAVTSRPGHRAPVNNGAVYVAAGARDLAVALYARAAKMCGTHWGADQESVGEAVAPVPAAHVVSLRHGARILFAPMETHNDAPLSADDPNTAYVVHFKGKRKGFMAAWARRHLGLV